VEPVAVWVAFGAIVVDADLLAGCRDAARGCCDGAHRVALMANVESTTIAPNLRIIV